MAGLSKVPSSIAATALLSLGTMNGFAATYDSRLRPIEPNESVTKLSLASDDGNRCWITVIPSALITTPDDARTAFSLFVSHPDKLRGEYLKIYKEVSEISATVVTVSGNHEAAMLTYAVAYEALGAELHAFGHGSHLFVPGSTYKLGCSSARPQGEDLSEISTTFLRGFS